MRKIMTSLFGLALASSAVAEKAAPLGLNFDLSSENRRTVRKNTESKEKVAERETVYKAGANYSIIPEVAVGGFVAQGSDNGNGQRHSLEAGVEVYNLAKNMGTSVQQIEWHYGHVNTKKIVGDLTKGGSLKDTQKAKDIELAAEMITHLRDGTLDKKAVASALK